MTDESIIVRSALATSRDARRLVVLLTVELAARYGDAGDDGTGQFHPEEAMPAAGGAFFVARKSRAAVGCIALRRLGPDAGEVKRLYVRPSGRGRGIARALLCAAEAAARDHGYDTVQLETGTRQPEAIALYESAGYYRIPNYGYYKDHPLSVCYAKKLASEETTDG